MLDEYSHMLDYRKVCSRPNYTKTSDKRKKTYKPMLKTCYDVVLKVVCVIETPRDRTKGWLLKNTSHGV